MEIYQFCYLISCIIISIIFIITRTLKGGTTSLLLKIFASGIIVASGILNIVYLNSDYNLIAGLITIGLLFGMIGDILLDLKVIYNNDSIYLNFGMLSFALGHICYFSAFIIYSLTFMDNLILPIIISVISAIILTFIIMFISKKLNLNFGKYFWQSTIYSFILTFMTVFTFAISLMGGNWILFIGLFSFLISDIILSLQYFKNKINSKPLIAINHTFYYLAQILILIFTFYL